MKYLKVTLFLMVLLAVSSCKKDDDTMTTCTPADWVGTYVGTIDCDGNTEDITVTITASGTDDIIISYQTATVSADYDPLPPDGCDLDISASGGGFTASVDGELDGNSLTFTETISDGTNTTSCSVTATRQ
ncbi:hypothetical protein [Flavilitoribacter nigricans]|uniref:Lipocalin-like domain-containing protein n=1 Tax=Flavilitoribacter nigricans (strain ATCC 23147 / DSM 23189 / NBRC 102662 / NCIMB 1420 / SS-2) TaxID=1122177 RepID=A0A2D0MXA5_FLAN2|nr:hypothetical protein [Flavilitoribacter nigricans]PHN00884.1 hypothetical protein CRP01_40050 [Flavilitoribacter nigricans DSM 23189 = NBRC 102662]